MKRYLTECAAGHAPGAGGVQLTLTKTHSASVTLAGHGLRLDFAALSGDVQMSMATVFQGPKGEQPPFNADEISVISTDPGNIIREGSDFKLFARMEWAGIPNW